ncbi:TPA: hypothetical protein ACTZ17_003864 [Bacillus cereus]
MELLERKEKEMFSFLEPNQEEKINIQNGEFLIRNVPHIVSSFPGPNGEKYRMSMGVARKISIIFKYMRNNSLDTFNYEEYNLIKDNN